MRHSNKIVFSLLVIGGVAIYLLDSGPRKGWCITYGASPHWVCTPMEGEQYTAPRNVEWLAPQFQ